ncbi:ketoacyl-ACP synthase III [bacterium]|nr:ketoacyl-ACP synthase III [bacterium]
MSLSKFKHVKVSGISVVVPEKEINIYDEAEYYGGSVKKIDRMRKMVGFWKRRVSDKETTPADLAYDAAQNLIGEMNIDKKDIDALVFVVQQPDVVNPSTAYFLHDKLGLSQDCMATDINQGCVGWVFGLHMVSQMIESGAYKKVLLLNGDTPSVGIDPSNRNSAPIFGDGGCATLVEFSEEEIESCYNIDTISSGFEAIISPFSGTRFRMQLSDDKEWNLLHELVHEKLTMPTGMEVPLMGGYMDGIAVFDFTINIVPKNIRKIMDYVGLTPNDIGALCLHQANKQIIQAVGTGTGFDLEKVPYTAFENYGNNTMCSIPTTLACLDKEIKKDKLCCCGYGNGLIAISSILNLENTYISEIKTFKKPEYVLTRDEYINYWRKKITGEISRKEEK